MTRPSGLARVWVVGRGKVGTAIARGLERSGARVETSSARTLLEARTHGCARAGLVVIAARDRDVAEVAARLALAVGEGRAPTLEAALHCAGGLGLDALAPLKERGVAVATMHPLLSFAARERPPRLAGGALVIHGEPVATDAAKRVARALGMRPVIATELDRDLYHAAAALVANGATALAALGAGMMERAGIADASWVLGPLLESVADNLGREGAQRALSGPVRRGDSATIARHLAAIDRSAPDVAALYRSLVQAQLPLARALGEASEEDLAAIAGLSGAPAAAPRRGGGVPPARG